MLATTKTSPRRVISIGSFLVAVVLGPFSIFLYHDRSSYSNAEMLRFLAVNSVALASGIAALLAARTPWRWLLLLLLLPMSQIFCERAWEFWSWSNRVGIFPYFLFLIPSALVAFALRALTRRVTVCWPQTSELDRHNIARAALQAFPFALALAPTWFTGRGFSFLMPAAIFLLLPGFGGLFGETPPDTERSRNIIVATISLCMLWALLAFIVLRTCARSGKEKAEDASRT